MSKVYETIPETTCYYSLYDKRIIWKWRSESHVTYCSDGSVDVLPEYFVWRHYGMYAKEAIRYPVGFHHRSKCLFAMKEHENGQIVGNTMILCSRILFILTVTDIASQILYFYGFLFCLKIEIKSI